MFKRKESVGERIKRLRIENKLTLEDVANKSLLVPDIINKYENNEKEVDYIYANILAKLTKTSVSYILYGTKRKTKNDKNSILEDIAKKDNPSLYNKQLTYKDALLIDDYGYSLIEYVSKYKSFKVFETLIESCERKKDYSFLYEAKSEIIPTWLFILNKEREVFKAFTNGEEVREISFFDNGFFYIDNLSFDGSYLINISKEFKNIFKYLTKDFDKLTNEQKEYYFNLNGKGFLKESKCWYYAYPFLVHFAYIYNKKLFIKLLDRIIESASVIKYQNGHLNPPKEGMYGFTYVLKDTLHLALSKGDVSNALLINKYLYRPYKEERLFELALENKRVLLNRDELMKILTNYGVIKLKYLFKLKDDDLKIEILKNSHLTLLNYIIDLFLKHKYVTLNRLSKELNIDKKLDAKKIFDLYKLEKDKLDISKVTKKVTNFDLENNKIEFINSLANYENDSLLDLSEDKLNKIYTLENKIKDFYIDKIKNDPEFIIKMYDDLSKNENHIEHDDPYERLSRIRYITL